MLLLALLLSVAHADPAGRLSPEDALDNDAIAAAWPQATSTIERWRLLVRFEADCKACGDRMSSGEVWGGVTLLDAYTAMIAQLAQEFPAEVGQALAEGRTATAAGLADAWLAFQGEVGPTKVTAMPMAEGPPPADPKELARHAIARFARQVPVLRFFPDLEGLLPASYYHWRHSSQPLHGSFALAHRIEPEGLHAWLRDAEARRALVVPVSFSVEQRVTERGASQTATENPEWAAWQQRYGALAAGITEEIAELERQRRALVQCTEPQVLTATSTQRSYLRRGADGEADTAFLLRDATEVQTETSTTSWLVAPSTCGPSDPDRDLQLRLQIDGLALQLQGVSLPPEPPRYTVQWTPITSGSGTARAVMTLGGQAVPFELDYAGYPDASPAGAAESARHDLATELGDRSWALVQAWAVEQDPPWWDALLPSVDEQERQAERAWWQRGIDRRLHPELGFGDNTGAERFQARDSLQLRAIDRPEILALYEQQRPDKLAREQAEWEAFCARPRPKGTSAKAHALARQERGCPE